ncbi:GNAT family N-acetyltransferase [Fictibacillus gelatini]|uniref:GNAT family N-acetyltransferase n=1 Tax=Fictibacillus gelatini TaxID=225985 RepID=UPI00041C905B|nr:GNAT family N-acetyltransferase [Fictibacillus gelatini]
MEFQKLHDKTQLDAYMKIISTAYPGFKTPPSQLRGWLDEINESNDQALYGIMKGDRLAAGVRLIEFDLNVAGTIVKAGGIGLVAVDILQRKQGVARELLLQSLYFFKKKGISIVTLYPFDTGFYKKMGFGHGTQISQYKIRPGSFPRYCGTEHLVLLEDTDENRKEVAACYNRMFKKTNGMTGRIDANMTSLFREGNHIIAYKEGKNIKGYMAFTYKSEATFVNDLLVKEFIYESPQVLNEMMAFFHSQKDQIKRVIIQTTDEHFRYVVPDASNGESSAFDSIYLESHVTAGGMMYRIIDIERFFQTIQERNFNNMNGTLKLTVKDPFLAENSQSIIITFSDGKPIVDANAEYKVELRINIDDFSSLLMGAIDVKALLRYGLATISDERFSDSLNDLFKVEQKPICTTSF